MSAALRLARATFPWMLGRAAAPLLLVGLAAVLGLASLGHDGTSEFAQGRDLEGVRLAWLAVLATLVLFVAPAGGWWRRWREHDRHWLAPRPVPAGAWFAAAFAAQLAAVALALGLTTATLGHLPAPTRAATSRTARVVHPPRALTAGEPRRTLALGGELGAGTLHVPVLGLGGTGTTPRVRVAVAGAAPGPEATVTGRRRLTLELEAGADAVTVERVGGTALLVTPVAPLELLRADASRAAVLAGFFLGVLAWTVLPLGLLFALGRWLRPALAAGATLALGVAAARLGLGPADALVDAFHLLEWNAVDGGHALGQLPRAALGVGLAVGSGLRPFEGGVLR